jgi:hypothetical protein
MAGSTDTRGHRNGGFRWPAHSTVINPSAYYHQTTSDRDGRDSVQAGCNPQRWNSSQTPEGPIQTWTRGSPIGMKSCCSVAVE